MLSIIYSLILIISLPQVAFAETSMLERMQKLERSLVSIRTVYTRTLNTPKGKKRVSYTRQGTGIIIDPSGLIVTNTHIIKNAPRIEVTLSNGRLFIVSRILFVSTEYDFSIIKITPPYKLIPVKFADSANANIGEAIMTIGSSEINNHSILAGRITSLIQSRSQGTIEFLETDLNLYQGDSGGPLFNAKGKLLGMVMGKHQSKQRSSLCIASDRIHEQYLQTLANIGRQAK